VTASWLALPACSSSPTPINAPLPTVTITITAGMTPSSALQSTTTRSVHRQRYPERRTFTPDSPASRDLQDISVAGTAGADML
jgi:hypothetical protein